MDYNSDGNDEFTAFLGLIMSSEKDFMLTDEIEAQFYKYCRTIIFSVIEPLLLALCERPLHDETHSSNHAKHPDKKLVPQEDSAQSESNGKQQHELDVSAEPTSLLRELKGLEADLKSIFEVRKCLLAEERQIPVRGKSEEVIRSLRGIHGAMLKLRNEIASSLEEKRSDRIEPQNLNGSKFRQLESNIAASIQEIDSLFEKLGHHHHSAKDDVENDLILCNAEKKVNKQQSTDKREQTPDGDCSSFLSAQDFGFIPDENIGNDRFDDKFGSVINDGSRVDDSSKIGESVMDSARKYVPIRASSSMLEFEYSTSSDEDEESSTSSKIQFDRTLSNASSVVDIESHEASFPTEKYMQLETSKIETENLGSLDGPPVSKDYLETSSGLNILKRVESRYIQEAREVLLNSLRGQEIEGEKLIANFSQTGLELMKFTYKDPLEEVAEILLAGPMKDIDIEYIFDCRPIAAVISDENDEKIDHGGINDLSSKPDLNCNSDRAIEPNELHDTLPNETRNGCTFDECKLQTNGMAEKKITHILQIVKMLRTIIHTLKLEGIKNTRYVSTECKQRATAEISRENICRESPGPSKDRTLIDHLLEELFKRILIKKFEQKMRAHSRISSDESLNQMLFDLNQSENTTPHSFSDDAFEDFKSDSQTTTKNQREDCDNSNDKASEDRHGLKETELLELKSPEMPSTSGCADYSENIGPSLTTVFDSSNSDQFCERHISDICSVMKSENPCFLQNLGKIEVKKLTESGESLPDPIKKVSIELLRMSDEHFAEQTVTLGMESEKFGATQKVSSTGLNESSQLDFPGAECDKSTQPSMQSNATELVEEEVDFNEQIRYLGQQIVDIEKYLSDFESEENIAETDENSTAGTSEDSNSKLVAPGKHCLLSPDAPRETTPDNICSENAAAFSNDKIVNVIQMTDESNTSIKISDQNLLKECGFLSSVGSSDLSSEDFSSSKSESFDYNSFTTADNFVPNSDLPVKDVFCANLVIPRKTTNLVFSSSTQNKSKFRFPDGAPKITESESAQHLVFTRDALSKIIRQEADALDVDVPSILSVIKGGNSKDVKVRISADTNFDVKLSKSDFESLVTAVKVSRPTVVEELAPKSCDLHSAEILIHKPNFKSTKTPLVTDTPSGVTKEASEKEVAQILIEKGSLMKILSSIIGKARSVESKETKGIVMNLSDSSLDCVNISKAVKISSTKGALGKAWNNLLGFPTKDKSKNSKSQTSTCVTQKISTHFDCSLSFGNLRSTSKDPEPAQTNILKTISQSSTDNFAHSKTEELQTQSAPRFKFGFAASSGMVNQRPRVDEQGKSKMFSANSFNGVRMMKSEPNGNFTETSEANNDVLSASSLSNFSESLHSLKNKQEKSSASSSESSIADRLFSASSSSLPGNEITASVLALEPTETHGRKAPSLKKMDGSRKGRPPSKSYDESFKPSNAKHAAPVNNLDTHRAAFKLIESCEQILNCKRRSDEIRSRSFNKANNPEGKSLVTVLKTVDEKFVDRTSSCGPTAFGKNSGSRPGNDVSIHNAESSELEEKNTRYDLIMKATEASENDTEIPRGSSDKNQSEDVGLLDVDAQRAYDPTDGEQRSDNSSDTSYETAHSEVFYDIPTVDSDLAYYLEIERKFTLSCAAIQRSLDESRGEETEALEMKNSTTKHNGKQQDHVRKTDLIPGCVKKQIPLKGADKIDKEDSALKRSNQERQETVEYLSGFKNRDAVKLSEPIGGPNRFTKYDSNATTGVNHTCGNDKVAKEHISIADMHDKDIGNWSTNKQLHGTHETDSLQTGTIEDKTSAGAFETFSVNEFCKKKKVVKKLDGTENKHDCVPRITKHVRKSIFGEKELRENTCRDRDPVEKARKSSKQSTCKKHRSIAKDDSSCQSKHNSESQNESVRARDSLRRCLSCKRIKGTKKDSKVKAKPIETSNDQSNLERQLNLIHNSFRLGARMHGQFYGNQDTPKYSPKTSRFECASPMRGEFQECVKNQHDVIFRSRFTRNHNRGEDSVDSTFESSSQSEVSHRTFRSDGEKVSIGSPALNANTLMEFFERVYGVYDHIRQCHSCKALMSQIIEEVITDLAAMKKSRT